jgi:hypothetical protein
MRSVVFGIFRATLYSIRRESWLSPWVIAPLAGLVIATGYRHRLSPAVIASAFTAILLAV